jgi:hypothetical protein
LSLLISEIKQADKGKYRVMGNRRLMIPKLSDSPSLTREAEMPQTLLECDTLKVWAIDFKFSPNR